MSTFIFLYGKQFAVLFSIFEMLEIVELPSLNI